MERFAEHLGQGILGYAIELLPELFTRKGTDHIRTSRIECVVFDLRWIGARLARSEIHKVADVERPALPLEQGGTQPLTSQNWADMWTIRLPDACNADESRLHAGQVVDNDPHRTILYAPA